MARGLFQVVLDHPIFPAHRGVTEGRVAAHRAIELPSGMVVAAELDQYAAALDRGALAGRVLIIREPIGGPQEKSHGLVAPTSVAVEVAQLGECGCLLRRVLEPAAQIAERLPVGALASSTLPASLKVRPMLCQAIARWPARSRTGMHLLPRAFRVRARHNVLAIGKRPS